MVQQFSWKRFSIDQPPSEAESLHWACWNRQPAAVRTALAAGADPNGRSATGSPPLLTLTLASKVARREPEPAVVSIVLQLVAAGADVNGGDRRGYTALHRASFACDVGTVGLLLDAGADANAKTAWGGTPLTLALLFDRSAGPWRTKTAARLLEGGANPDAEFGGKTLLFRLCACDALPEAELLPQLALLLRAGASAATRFDRHEGRLMSPALEVCRRGLGKALQLLITAGADVAAVGPDGRTPLCWAAARRDPGMVRVLLLAGADTALVGDAFQRAVLQQWQRDLISLRVSCQIAAGVHMFVKDMAATTADATAPPTTTVTVAAHPPAAGETAVHALPVSPPQEAAVSAHAEADAESDVDPQRAASIASESTQSIGGDDVDMLP